MGQAFVLCFKESLKENQTVPVGLKIDGLRGERVGLTPQWVPLRSFRPLARFHASIAVVPKATRNLS